MKRFLIFLFLFPAIATVSFYAVLYILTGAELDSLSGPAIGYLFFIGPALVLALVDWFIAAKVKVIPSVIGTTLVAYAVSVLAAAWAGVVAEGVPVLGLIGAIPAAVCSWLSGRKTSQQEGR
jgi:hypothetical protein